ncbi:hypothetical protein MKW92_027427 [Papaver armeniacum]|nr:hypothetical protein MKW92_027427 [Papaver armeniacum]
MFAIFTGTKKGIWHGIIRRLALECVTVVLTARDEKIGSITVSLLVKYGLGNVFLYQLDVQDQCSVVSLAKYVKIQFGRLDNCESEKDDLKARALEAANAVQVHIDFLPSSDRMVDHAIESFTAGRNQAEML